MVLRAITALCNEEMGNSLSGAHFKLNIMQMFVFQADIYAGAIFIQQSVGWNMYVGIVALLVITAIYTVSGFKHLFY